MQYIRTAEAMARVLDTPLEPGLERILTEHQERLAAYYDFAFEELAEFLIVERGEELTAVEGAYGCQWAPKFPQMWALKIPYVGGLVSAVINRNQDRDFLSLAAARGA